MPQELKKKRRLVMNVYNFRKGRENLFEGIKQIDKKTA
jgi:hypothetical protein